MPILLIVMLFSLLTNADEFCIVVNEEAKIIKYPRNNKKVSISPKFGYGFTVGKRYPSKKVQSNRTHVSMEKNKNKNEIGWVSVKDIICSKNKETSSPYIEADFIKLENGKKTTLHKKAFITNTILKGKEGLSIKTKLPRYTSSSANTTTNESSKLYEIYFLLKEENNRYLLSKNDTIFSDVYNDNKNKNLIGWVKKEHSKLWDTRVAIEPLDNTLEGYLDKSLDKKSEYTEVIEKPKMYYSFRYPLLEETDKYVKISYMQNEKSYSVKRDLMSKVLHQKSNHIVFLLDATLGMQNVMNNVKKAISKYLRETKDKNFKVAVALYRDYSDGKDKYDLITRGWVSPNKAISYMQGQYFEAKSDSSDSPSIVGEDKAYLEALFNGIISLTEDRRLNLSNYPGNKIVLIGDHGNHQESVDNNGYTINDVVKKLGASSINAIQVHTYEHLKYVKKFKTDIESINRARKSGTFVQDNIGSIDTINLAIKQTFKDFKKVKKITIDIIKGIKLTDEQKDYYNRSLNIDIKNYGTVQQSLILYIPKSEFNKYKKTLLVKASVVEDWAKAYTKIGKIIAKYHNGSTQQKKLRLSLTTAIESLTGEEIHAYDNISSFLQKRMRTNHKSILNLKFRDWIDKILKNRNGYNKKMIKLFKEKGVMLQALYMEKVYINIHLNTNKEIVYTVARDGNGQEKVKKSKFNISLMTDNKSTKQINYNDQWIWVDFKYLP